MRWFRYFAGGLLIGVFFGALVGGVYTIFAHSKIHPDPASGATVESKSENTTLYIRPSDIFRQSAMFLTIPLALLGRAILPGARIKDEAGTRLVLPPDRPRHFVTLGFWVGAIGCFLLLAIDAPIDAFNDWFNQLVLPKS